MKIKNIVASTLAIGMLVGCGAKNTATADPKAPKFAFIGPLSGSASQYGQAVKNALELGIKDYNAKHGTKITAVYYDDKNDATEAVNAYNKAVDSDKVTAVLSPVTTAPAVAVASASQQNKTPILTPSGTGDKITINPSTNKAYENVFRIATNDSYAGTYLAQLSNTQFKYKKVAILYNKELDYSAGLNTSFQEEAKKQNVSIVYDGAYNTNTKDFSTYISKVKAANPDAIFLPDYYESVVAIAKQLRDAGINKPLIGGDGWDGILAVKGVNVANFENTYYVSGFDKDATTGPAKAFIDSYKKAYGSVPNMFAAQEYDAVTVIMKAINEAKSTEPSKINAALAKVELSADESATGAFKYDENHNPVKKMVVVTVKNGKYVTVK